MLGAIAGDVIGSVHEHTRTKSTDFDLVVPGSRFTDDTVLAVAVADCLLSGLEYVDVFHEYFFAYPNAGYGLRFFNWARLGNRQPYNSYGNGSAMRVPAVGHAFDSLDEVLAQAARSVEVTHNHPEGVKGAQATAAAVFMARTGETMSRIKQREPTTRRREDKPLCAEDKMTLEIKATILGIIAGGIAVMLGMWPTSRRTSDTHERLRFPSLVAISLAVVSAALIAVGLVSGTLTTHLVQILPVVIVLTLLAGSPQWGSAAAGSVLSFWLVTMVGIWLFLLGLSRFLTGTFSPTEITLTVVIGVASLVGLAANGRTGGLSLTTRVPAAVVAAGLQALALWFSYQPIVTGR